MKIYCHNFSPSSNTGPNKFTRQLINQMSKDYKVTVSSQKDCDAEFALIHLTSQKRKPTILRLDGIYFNITQNYQEQNAPIKYAYDNSDSVVFQSKFNKSLTEFWFGPHKNSSVIHNGADIDLISTIDNTILDDHISKETPIWSCASSWRPHKRLEENLRYFHEKAPKDALMIVAGKNPDISIIKKYMVLTRGRIHYVGELDYQSLISLYKRSSTFVHLAFLDHCPNVVVDAQASGCDIICASSGGTKEIVKNGTVIQEEVWDFSPIKLYEPPTLDFKSFLVKKSDQNLLDIRTCSSMYFEKIRAIL